MNSNNNIDRFEFISINGRFIYGYLCLLNTIEHCKYSSLPNELDALYNEFLYSDKLNEWHSKVEEILPSFILDTNGEIPEYFSIETVQRIKEYYKKQPPFLVDMIENLFYLGISNLYVGFNSENSLQYLNLILQTMADHLIPLPDFEKIRYCSIADQEGWGNKDNLINYTS